MPFSTAYANEILNYTLAQTKNILTDAPLRVYIGLSSNDPEADGGVFNELSGGGYARVLVSDREGVDELNYFGDASGRQISNTKQINWNKATTDWPTVHGFGLFKSNKATETQPFFYGKIQPVGEDGVAQEGLTVPRGAVALFDAGMLRLSFSTHDELEAAAEATAE